MLDYQFGSIRPLTFFRAVFFIFSVVFFAIYLFNLAFGLEYAGFLLVSITLFFVCGVLDCRVSYGRLDLFNPFIPVSSMYIFVYVFGSAKYFLGNESIGYPLVLVLLSLVSFFCGGKISSRSTVFNASRAINARRYFRTVWILSAFVFFLSGAFTVYLISKVGIPFLHENKVVYRFEAREQVSSYVIYMIRASTVAFYLVFAYSLSRFKTGLPRDLKWLLAFVFLYVVCINLIPGWRGPIILFVFCCVLIFHFLSSGIRFRYGFLIAPSIISLVIGWGFLRVLSAESQRGVLDYFYSISNSDFQVMLLWVSSNISVYFWGLMSVVEVIPERLDYFYGGVYLNTLSTVLPGKQDNFDLILKFFSGMEFEGGGLNPTIVGEAYADFGFSGVIIYSFFWGWVLNNMYRAVLACRAPTTVALFSYVTAVSVLGVMTGVLGQAVYSFNLLVMFILIKIVGVSRKKYMGSASGG